MPFLYEILPGRLLPQTDGVLPWPGRRCPAGRTSCANHTEARVPSPQVMLPGHRPCPGAPWYHRPTHPPLCYMVLLTRFLSRVEGTIGSLVCEHRLPTGRLHFGMKSQGTGLRAEKPAGKSFTWGSHPRSPNPTRQRGRPQPTREQDRRILWHGGPTTACNCPTL